MSGTRVPTLASGAPSAVVRGVGAVAGSGANVGRVVRDGRRYEIEVALEEAVLARCGRRRESFENFE